VQAVDFLRKFFLRWRRVPGRFVGPVRSRQNPSPNVTRLAHRPGARTSFEAANANGAIFNMSRYFVDFFGEHSMNSKLMPTLLALLFVSGCGDAEQPASTTDHAPGNGVASETATISESARSARTGASSSKLDPEETRSPNADWQTPAFEGQTRAPRPAETAGWQLETVAEGLVKPWALEFLPDGSMLVTEQGGTLRIVSVDGAIGDPIAGVPEVHAVAQGGLLDVALAPDFAQSRRIYLSYSEPTERASRTAAATGILSQDGAELTDVEVIFRQQPEFRSRGHYGSRIVFDEQGYLYVTTGDRMDRSRELAQDPSNTVGVVARVNPDGSIPESNPFVGDPERADDIWSWGHRNIQAAALHPASGELWTIEHGPAGGDELNNPEAGKNYGWPAVTYGENYNGSRVTEGITQRDDVEQPVYYWDPVIAPSGMAFYTGEAFPTWQGDLFIGGLASARVVRLVFDGERVAAEEWLPIGERVRDVRQGPDGFLYLVTDHENGKILRIRPST
jgi:glucose/arabinose dehydrogenase